MTIIEIICFLWLYCNIYLVSLCRLCSAVITFKVRVVNFLRPDTYKHVCVSGRVGGGGGGKKCLFFGKFDVIYFLIPVDTRLRFNVYKTSSDIKKVNNFYWLFTFAKTIIIDVLQGLNPLLPNVPS